MSKLAIPAILVATVMVAGIFAFMPVEQASTVHTTIGVLNTATADGVTLNGAAIDLIDLTGGTAIAEGTVCASLTENVGSDDSIKLTALAAAGETVDLIAAGTGTTTGCEIFTTQIVTATAGADAADVISYSIAWRQASP